MTETFLCKSKLHRLTEVSLISTKYGTDRDIRILGYIAEDPYVVFVELFKKYFVSVYKEELYPLCNTQLKHTLSIKDVGNRYEPFNFSKAQFHDITSFTSLVSSLELAKIINDPNDNKASKKTLGDAEEYNQTLEIIKENNPIVKKAMDQVSLLRIYRIEGNDPDANGGIDYLKNRINLIHKYSTDDYETMALLSHIMKMVVDISYDRYM